MFRRSDGTVGSIVTLAINDSQRIMECARFIAFLFLGPTVAIVVTSILLFILGPSILMGMAVMLLLVPAQRLFATRIGRVRTTPDTCS